MATTAATLSGTAVPVVSAPAAATPQIAVAAPVPRSSLENPVSAQAPRIANTPGWAGMAFIGGGESNKIWVLDAYHHKLVNAIDVGGPLVERTDPKAYPNLRDAHAVVFSKDFKEFYTVDSWEYAQSWVIKYDPRTLREVGRAPAGRGGHHLAMSPDDKYVYVGNQYDTKVSVIDAKTVRKVKDIEVGLGPNYITPSMYWDGKAIDSPYLWVSVDKENKVVAIDWKTNEIAKTVTLKGASHGINLTPDGKSVWTGDAGTKEMVIIDNATLEVARTFPTPEGRMTHIVFSPDSKYAYFTAGGKLQKYDTQTLKPVWISAAGGAHLGVTPDGKEVWTLAHTFEQGDRYPYTMATDGATAGALANAKVVNAETGEFIAEMPFEYRPHEMQFVPYSAVGMPRTTAPIAIQATPPASAAPAIRAIKLKSTYDLFQPDTVTARPGERVEFEITNQDDYLHDFLTVGDTPGQVNVDLPGNSVVKVEWTAPQASGKYQFQCDIHPGQVLTVVVP
jgi:YVTN family beta-propeller protein